MAADFQLFPTDAELRALSGNLEQLKNLFLGGRTVQLLESVLEGGTLHISRGRKGFSLSICGPDQGLRSAVHEQLLEALLALRPIVKQCKNCMLALPFSAFAADQSSPDGHLRRCKVCERKRVKEYDRKQKAGG